MKLMYKIILFFVIFYIVVIMINLLNIFPQEAQFYSDSNELKQLKESDGSPRDAATILGLLFVPSVNAYGLDGIAVSVITGFIIGGAIVSGIIIDNAAIPSIIIVGFLFFNMISTSYSFFQNLFEGNSWTTNSLQFLAICIMIAAIMVTLFTLVEMQTQGRSG